MVRCSLDSLCSSPAQGEGAGGWLPGRGVLVAGEQLGQGYVAGLVEVDARDLQELVFEPDVERVTRGGERAQRVGEVGGLDVGDKRELSGS